MYISAENLLRDTGLRITPGRLYVLKALQKAGQPLDFFEITQSILPIKLDQATVYRILKILQKKELVQPVQLEKGKQRWELTSHHHHLTCIKCGRVENLDDCNLQNYENKLTLKSKFSNIKHSLEFQGLCDECAL